MTASIKEHKIVPDILDESWDFQLNVKFGSYEASYGNELTPTQVKEKPEISWNENGEDYHTLLMVDPDAPKKEHPKNAEWLHWLVGNILGADVARGDEIVEYIGASPPKNTGFHRYAIILFKQPSKLRFEEKVIRKNVGSGRAKFSTRKFASKYNLESPIAGNFFQAQYDKTCDEIFKKLK